MNNDSGKILAALLAGMAAGAAIGILFAPEKGTDTRDKLNESLKDLGEAIKERSSEQVEHIKELSDKVSATLKSKLKSGELNVEGSPDEHV
ncbi:MAG TPA: YtxH domain-containing protein [Sphingobacteriaceae bacterium]|nr:YtxH domain-containing protein [Sphingobacteriaceae bacterium]